MIARRKAEARRIELEERDRMLREAREVHGTEQWWDWQAKTSLWWWLENHDLATTDELAAWSAGHRQWQAENGRVYEFYGGGIRISDGTRGGGYTR